MRFYIDEPRLASGAAQPEITIGLNTTDSTFPCLGFHKMPQADMYVKHNTSIISLQMKLVYASE